MAPHWPVPYVPDPTHFALDAFVSFCVAVLLAVLVNAEAQAFVSTFLGDRRVGAKDRFHFIAFFHLDVLGSINYLLGGFGWARLMDIDPTKFKHPRFYTFLSRLAGPVANLLLANIGATLAHLMSSFGGNPQVFNMLLGVSVTTAVFNLIPLPPLAGGFLVLALIPQSLARAKEMFMLAGPYLILALTLLDRLYPQLFMRTWLDYLALKVFTFLAGG